MNDHLSDMLARIKNAYRVGKKSLSLPHTRLCAEVARVMVENHYLAAATVEGDAKKTLKLELLYVDGVPALSAGKRVSKPGVRIYAGNRSLKPVLSGMGLSILSTSRGVMSDQQARQSKVGGEILLEIW